MEGAVNTRCEGK